jgi:hypothetical protein
MSSGDPVHAEDYNLAVAENRFTILLQEDVPVDPRKYGALVAPALGLTQVEARMAVRKGRGIFLENLAEADARALAAELEKDSIGARVVSQETVPAFPKVRLITLLERGELLLEFKAPGTGEPEAVPWDALLVVQIGIVARPEFKELFGHVPFNMIPAIHKMEGAERELVRENLMLKMDAKPPDNRLKSQKRPGSIFEEIDQTWGKKVRVFADLLTADLGLWLRVPLDAIAYTVVEGGVRQGGPWGFQLLVDDLVARCGAALTERALKLLKATDIREHVFPHVEEYNRLTQWVALKRVLWPAADSSSPSPEPPESPTDAGSSNASPPPAPPSTSS